jgi:hypothetical protein
LKHTSHLSVEGWQEKSLKLFIEVFCCALPRTGDDEMLMMLLPLPFVSSKRRRRVWKVLFQHVTHALSGFSRLSHKNVLSEHNRKKGKRKKSFSGKSGLTLFQILTFIVIHSSSDVKKRTSIKLFCAVSLAFFMRIKRIIRKISIIFFIVYQRTQHTETFTNIKTASRFSEKLTS